MSGVRCSATLAALLLAACSPPPTPPASAQPEAPADASPQSPKPAEPTRPDSQEPGPDPERVVFPAKSACPGGLDLPAFDPAAAPWWDLMTKAQRAAFVESSAYTRWSAVTTSPILVQQVQTELVLRSVDGCWRQVLASNPIRARLNIDGLSGVAWQWHPKGLSLIDLWDPGAPIPIFAESVAAKDLAIVGGDGSVLLQWSDRTVGTHRPPQAKLEWGTAPRLVPARSGGEAQPLTQEGERWLVEHLGRQAPGPRTTRLTLSFQHSLPAESRCKDPAVCLNAAPFGASGLELVYYGEHSNPTWDGQGPLCAFFDPSSGDWYKDPTGAVKASDPRQFDENETPCGSSWMLELTGRAYLNGGQVCVSTQCIRTEGSVYGFARGDISVSI